MIIYLTILLLIFFFFYIFTDLSVDPYTSCFSELQFLWLIEPQKINQLFFKFCLTKFLINSQIMQNSKTSKRIVIRLYTKFLHWFSLC